MENKNKILSDIEIPDVVQKKAEEAFMTIKKGGADDMKQEEYIKQEENIKQGGDSKQGKKMRPLMKFVAVAAACAVVITGAHIGENFYLNQKNGEDSSDITAKLDDAFTLKVNAEELTEGQQLPIMGMGAQKSWVICGEEDKQNINYCIGTLFTCEGDNIESITYSINKGAFQIIESPDESIVTDGVKYDGQMNTGMITAGSDWEEDTEEIHYSENYYTSYTVAYDKQTYEKSSVNICNELASTAQEQEVVFGEEQSLEKLLEAYSRIVDGVVITCQVTYTDGTTSSRNIVVGSTIMTHEQAGEISETPDEKDAYFTYELQ